MFMKKYKMKYRQIVRENKPRDVWDGEFEYELIEGDKTKAKAIGKMLKKLMKNAKELRKVKQEVIQ